MKQLLDFFITFCKIGGLTFGGGYAMLPLLQKEVVENKGWVKEEELVEYYAISQCIPGPMAVSIAILVGYKQKGIACAIFAALGIIMPSIIIIMLLAALFQEIMDIPLVGHAFAGIRIAVVALVIQSVVVLGKSGVKDIYGLLIMVVAFILATFTDISIIYIIVAAGILGIFIRKRGEDTK